MCIELRAGVCFSGVCFIRMLHVFYLDIAYVAMAIHVCCKYIFQMFQLFHLNAACFYLDVAHVAVAICVYCKCIQMFHMFHTYVASVLYECCICYSVCCKRIFQFVSPCFSMLQQVLLSTRSNSLACTRCRMCM
jgi:energy-converting hydrogenase Eha subunit C